MRNAFFFLSIAAMATATGCSGDTFAPAGSGGVAGSSPVGGRAGFAGSDQVAGAPGAEAGRAGAAGDGVAGTATGGTGGTGGSESSGGMGGADAGGSAGAVAEGGASGNGQGGASGAGQGGASGAGQGGAGASGAAGTSGAGGAPPLDCPVLYVSPSGDDAQLGCSPASPMRTLNGALVAAKNRVGLKEIRACQGVFEEPALDFDRPLALRGGYTCDSFERATPVTPEKRTVVTPKAGVLAGFAMRVGTAASALDGFDVRGPLPPLSPTGNAPLRHELGAALVFAGGTKADVRDTSAAGAKLSTPGEIAGPTAAVEIKADAAPTFTRCRFEGGDGSTDGTDADLVGSVGVLLRASGSRPRFSATSIDGGGGKGISLGSVGVLSYGAKLVGADKLTGAVVNGGAGRSVDGNPSVGLLLLSGEVEVEDALFDGGSGKPSGVAAVGTVGIAAGKDVKLRLSRARVYGGDVAPDAAVAAHASVALQAYGASELLVVNSVLHGGGGAAPAGGLRSSYALVVAGVATTHVGFSTLVGSAGTTGGAGVVVRPHEPSLGTIVPSQSVTVDGSLFLVGNGIGFLHEQSSSLPVLRGNAFATGTAAAACKDCTSGSKLFVDAPDEFGAFPGSVENLILIASGATETVKGFLPLCGTLATCGAVLFDGFGGPSDGKAGVADREKGYKLKANLPCAFLKLFTGGGSSNTPPATDAFGSSRTSRFSPGASEQDNCTPLARGRVASPCGSRVRGDCSRTARSRWNAGERTKGAKDGGIVRDNRRSPARSKGSVGWKERADEGRARRGIVRDNRRAPARSRGESCCNDRG